MGRAPGRAQHQPYTHGYWVRGVFTTFVSSYAAIDQIQYYIPQLAVALPVTLIGNALAYVLSRTIGFPLPFTLTLSPVPWSCAFFDGLFIPCSRFLRAHSGVLKAFVAYLYVCGCQLSMIVLYSTFYAAMELFSLLALAYMLRRRVRISALHQLAIVRDKQWHMVQSVSAITIASSWTLTECMSSSSSTFGAETGYELPRELERTLHESVLRPAREQQRTAFRPGVTSAGKAVDVLLLERSAKKIAKALKALQDDYGFDARDAAQQRMAHEALQYTNKLEDALQFLALQHSSDELPSVLRATPTATGPATARAGGDDDDNGELSVAVHAKPLVAATVDDVDDVDEPIATSASNEAVAPPAAEIVVADSWEDDVAADDGLARTPVPESASDPTATTTGNDGSTTTASTEPSDTAPSASDSHARTWTQQYVAVIAAREVEEARRAAAFAALSPDAKRVLELETQFAHVQTLVADAKVSKAPKKKQKTLALELSRLRQQLIERGWDEREYVARMRAADSTDGEGNGVDGDGESVKPSRRRKQSPQPDDVAVDATAAAVAAVRIDTDDDDESGGASLFADDTPSSTPSSSVATAAAAPDSLDMQAPASPRPTAKSRNSNSKKQSWTGKSPRDHVLDHCRKLKLPLPMYRKLSVRGRNAHLYALVIDYKSHKREFVVPSDSGGAFGFDAIDVAKDTVATHALYAINCALPLYRVLPPAYRDLWLTWDREKARDAADAVSTTRAGVDAVVRSLVDAIPDEVRAKKSTVVVPDAVTAAGGRTTETTGTRGRQTGKRDNDDEDDDDDGVRGDKTAGGSKVLADWAMDDWDADDASDSEAAATAATTTVEPADNWDEPETSSSSSPASSPPVKPEPEDPAAASYSHALKTKLLASMQSQAATALLSQRQALPIAAFKRDVLAALDAHDVLLISGETGCGKSTQVPQFLLEHALVTSANGAATHIVCTQPRRLAAMSLADRVSHELGESAMGVGDSLCGYQVRLESRVTRDTRLVFCTTGVLLRRLQSPATLAHDVSHIIVDEVHERDLQSDVLLALLRQFLAAANAHRATRLKVVLMSATLNAAAFQQYFGGEQACPMLMVPGRTFAVTPYYLEDVVEMTAFTLDDTHPSYVQADSSVQHSTQLKVTGRGGASFAQTVYWDASAKPSARSTGSAKVDDSGEPTYSERTLKTLECIDASVINYDLIVDLLERLATESELLVLSAQRPSASVLVFLPGLYEISMLLDRLNAHRLFADDNRFALLPLHSSLAAADQQRIFAMPRGIVRIIATTNIAETSLTVEDVKVVVDSGRVKEMRHDSAMRTNVLVDVWTARANAMQRMGRAGRTSGGVCYRLYPRAVFSHTMAAQPVPEIRRAPLTSLCLQIKTFRGISGSTGDDAPSCSEFLGACLDPPSAASVRDALHELVEIGALEHSTEKLTTLGRTLATLPVDVKVGKMLLLGAVFNVFDAVATSAAVLETKSPFVAPYGQQSAMQTARKRFAVAQSDVLTDVNAYETWRAHFQHSRSNRAAERAFCRTHFLSLRALLEITKLKQQFYTLVAQAGHLRPPTSARDSPAQLLSRDQTAVVSAILFAGLAPNLVHIERGAGSSDKRRVVLRDQDHAVVVVHPGSINHKVAAAALASPFLTYAVKLHTSQVYVPTSSLVLPAAVCLFSHALDVVPLPRTGSNSGSSTTSTAGVAVRVNDWVVFHSSFRSAAVLQALRSVLAAFVARSLETPRFGREKHQKQKQNDAAQDDDDEAAQLHDALRSLLASELDVHDPKHALTKLLCSARKEPLA